MAYPSTIPAAPDGPEPYALRRATPDDIPFIAALYDQRRRDSLVSAIVPEAGAATSRVRSRRAIARRSMSRLSAPQARLSAGLPSAVATTCTATMPASSRRGGDCAWALSDDPECLARIAQGASEFGFQRLTIGLCGPGTSLGDES